MTQNNNSIAERIFLTSDHHFSHFSGNQHSPDRGIIKFTNRPWEPTPEGTEEMDEQLILNWNNTVPKDGLVYHLGDIFFGSSVEKAMSIRRRLNGNIFLIRGNHDRLAEKMQSSFAWIKDYYKLRIPDLDASRGEQILVLFHYPIASFENAHHGAFCCYGHCHSSFNKWQSEHLPEARMFDVGVDSFARYLAQKDNRAELKKEDYRPMSYAEIKEIMSTKKGMSVDHHD